MDEKTFHVMKENIEKYFESITKDKLQQDLEKANYQFYKKVDVPIIDELDEGRLSVDLYKATAIFPKNGIIYSKAFEAADSYKYKVAA